MNAQQLTAAATQEKITDLANIVARLYCTVLGLCLRARRLSECTKCSLLALFAAQRRCCATCICARARVCVGMRATSHRADDLVHFLSKAARSQKAGCTSAQTLRSQRHVARPTDLSSRCRVNRRKLPVARGYRLGSIVICERGGSYAESRWPMPQVLALSLEPIVLHVDGEVRSHAEGLDH